MQSQMLSRDKQTGGRCGCTTGPISQGIYGASLQGQGLNLTFNDLTLAAWTSSLSRQYFKAKFQLCSQLPQDSQLAARAQSGHLWRGMWLPTSSLHTPKPIIQVLPEKEFAMMDNSTILPADQAITRVKLLYRKKGRG